MRNLLRGFDLSRPRGEAWWELASLLRSGEPIEDEDALARELDLALAHWPDELRFADFFEESDDAGSQSQSSRIMRKLARSTSLDHSFVEAAASEAFFRTSPSVVHLQLHEVYFEGADDWPAFVRAAGSQLRTLSISECGLTDDALLALAGTPLANALLGFAFHDDETANDVLAPLLGALPHLEELALEERFLDETFVRSIRANGVSERLRALTLHDCGIDDPALAAMHEVWPLSLARLCALRVVVRGREKSRRIASLRASLKDGVWVETAAGEGR